jgi:hypothetical protein
MSDSPSRSGPTAPEGGGLPASRTEIATFLHFGFLPRLEPSYRTHPWSRLTAAHGVRAEDCAPDELRTRGVEFLRAACAVDDARTHVIPLSGGIDSRLILGLLAERVPRERLVAVTFGVPGALDFEIAPAVARAAGVRHELLDLSAWPLTRAELLETARAAPWASTFEVHYNRLVFQRFGAEVAYWSGNQANSIAGEDAHVRHASWAEACREFAAELPAVRGFTLTPPDFRPELALPSVPPLDDTCLTHVEQLFMLVRNPGRNDPAQMPPGFDVRAPFRAAPWVEFMLSLPPEIRRAGAFYAELATRACPALFALPLKNSHGLAPDAARWRVGLERARQKAERTLRARFPRALARPNPKLNYADFDRELRGDGALARVVEESLVRLAEARVVDWLEPLELWQRHRRWRANLGDALVLLCALELNLAANGAPRSAAPVAGPGGRG